MISSMPPVFHFGANPLFSNRLEPSLPSSGMLSARLSFDDYPFSSDTAFTDLLLPTSLSKPHQTQVIPQLLQSSHFYESTSANSVLGSNKTVTGKKRKREVVDHEDVFELTMNQKGNTAQDEKKPPKRRKVEKSVERIDGELEFEMKSLLDENDRHIQNLRKNLSKKQPDENLMLIAKFRENIIRVLTCMSRMSGIMSRMPPIPVKLNTICVLNNAPSPPSFSSFSAQISKKE